MAGVIDEEGAADLRSLVQEQGLLSFKGFAEWALRQPTFDLMANLCELFTLVDSDANGYLNRIGVVWIDAHHNRQHAINTPDSSTLGLWRSCRNLAGCDLLYVSFDVNSLDATICKGTGTPSPGGLWADEARRLLRTLLRDQRVVCWEICEINPHLDSLHTLAEASLGIYQSVLEVLDQRL